MSGKDKFKKYNKIIKLMSKILSVFNRKRLEKLYEKFKYGESSTKLVIRYCILCNILNSIGDNVFIGECVTFKNPENISIGSNVSIHKNCYLDGKGKISIKDNVSIATDVKMFSFNHLYQDMNKPIKYNDIEYGEINIENDVWIGTSAIVLKGVNIGTRTVIGAGTIVTKNIKEHSLAVGNPAKIIKEI